MASATADLLVRHIRKLAANDANKFSDRELLGRFIARRDEAAFAALVQKHGPMVWRVCRRVLHDHHDAEDAFQATFLTLSRKAGSVRRRESLGSWLYGVAYRIVLKARRTAARRTSPRLLSPAGKGTDLLADVTVREAQAILDEELARLPEKYRAPLVLCCLEGATRDEAARQLGWSASVVKSRLEEARERLRRRLIRRGLTVPAALTAAFLAEGVAPAAVPAVLAQAVTKAAILTAAGMADAVSANVAALLDGAVKAGSAIKLKMAALLLAGLCVIGAGAGVVARRGSTAAEPPPQQEEKPNLIAQAPNSAKTEQPTPEEPKQVHTDRHGDPLPEGAMARLGTVHFRHGRNVHSVAFSEDGKTLLSGSFDGTVRLWDRATGKELRRFAELPPYAVVRVAFLPDGKTAAGLAGDGRIRFWELGTGKQLGWIEGGSSFAFAPDGKVVATGNVVEGLIQLWDWPTGRELRRLQGHKGRVFCVAFSPDGTSLASAGRDNTIRLWDPGTGRELRRLEADIRAPIFAPQFLAFSPDGQTIACGTGTKTIRLWETTTGKELRQFRDVFGEVCVVAFSPGRERNAVHAILWSGDLAHFFARRGVPQPNRPVPAGGRQDRAIGREGNGTQGAAVAEPQGAQAQQRAFGQAVAVQIHLRLLHVGGGRRLAGGRACSVAAILVRR
jgi:RNA polymerase sigma factor (sigma-70 family)